MSRVPVVWRFVVGLSLCACSSNDGDGGSNEDEVPDLSTVAGFLTAEARAFCSKLYECCSADDLMANPQARDSASDCAAFTRSATSNFSAHTDAVAAQRLEYDAAMGQQCIDNYPLWSCDDVRAGTLGAVASCAETLVPKVMPGGSCEQSYECIDTWCDYGDRICVQRKADGEPCNLYLECASGYCELGVGCSVPPATSNRFCRGF